MKYQIIGETTGHNGLGKQLAFTGEPVKLEDVLKAIETEFPQIPREKIVLAGTVWSSPTFLVGTTLVEEAAARAEELSCVRG